MSRNPLILIFWLLLTPLFVISQTITPESEREYIVEELSLPGGRIGNNVNAIAQGPNGFIWFATHGGLHRYDGYEFITYGPDLADTVGETTSLTFPYLEGIYWDSKDKLWVCSYGGGLYRFDPITEEFKHFPHVPGDNTSISDSTVLCAMEDAAGRLWVGTARGLNLYDPVTETFKRYYADPDDPGSLHDDDIRKIYIDKQGTMWLGAGHTFFAPTRGALSKYDPQTDTFINYLHDPEGEHSLNSPGVRGMLEDSRGNFWIGNSDGLFKMDRENGVFEKMLLSDSLPYAPGIESRSKPVVYSILEDANGGLWIGTIMDQTISSHLLRYDPENRKIETYPVRSSVWDLVESKDGTLWAAGAGVSGRALKIRPRTKTYQLGNDDLILSNFLESPLAKELEQFEEFSFLSSPLGLAIDSTAQNFWLSFIAPALGPNQDSSLAILAHHRRGGKTSFHTLPQLDLRTDINNAANQYGFIGLLMDRFGKIWGSYGSENVGLFSYDPVTKKLDQYLHDPSDPSTISSNGIVKMIMDSRGEIWFTTFDAGVNRLNPNTGKVTRYKVGTSYNVGNIGNITVALCEDPDGKIWVGGELLDEFGFYYMAIVDPETDEIQKLALPGAGTHRSIDDMEFADNGFMVFSSREEGIGTYGDMVGFYFSANDPAFPLKNVADIVYSGFGQGGGDFWIASADDSRYLMYNYGSPPFIFQEFSGLATTTGSGVLGPDGHVYFLNGLGWVEIDPEKINPELKTSSKKIEIVELTINGEKQIPGNSILEGPVWLSNDISLPASAENFALRFTDFDYQNPNPLFEYRLTPYESAWRSSENSPIASYFKVPAGDYRFQIRSKKVTGEVDSYTKEMAVTILPPWYFTWLAYVLYAVIFGAGVFGVHTFQKERTIRNEREKIKDRELEQAKKVEKAYEDLKATQDQLIQSEKMASLGELTAGIAHEIQNPLNFVNNFSDVNLELAEELKDAVAKGNMQEAEAIITDMIENEKKIHHHGGRADAIVKGMLLHSRGSSEEKELTDINELADEYLRLSYHGLRAKDKSFNADFKVELDESLPKVEVVPQDIGRVLLNMINNAFYSVSEKKKHSENGYAPTVIVSTRKNGNGVEINVKDNGVGIPQEHLDRIFEPFYSTKPSGKGTGLGLSLSYEIVTKGHGGKIDVKSKVGEGSEFIVQIPVS